MGGQIDRPDIVAATGHDRHGERAQALLQFLVDDRVTLGAVGSDPAPGVQDLSVGAGLGVRYNLGFAPIRFDIAVPVTERNGSGPYQIYISIGQSF